MFSGLKRLTKEEVNFAALIPLLFFNSKGFSFKPSSASLFSVKLSVVVFVIFREVSLIVPVRGLNNTFIS